MPSLRLQPLPQDFHNSLLRPLPEDLGARLEVALQVPVRITRDDVQRAAEQLLRRAAADDGDDDGDS